MGVTAAVEAGEPVVQPGGTVQREAAGRSESWPSATRSTSASLPPAPASSGPLRPRQPPDKVLLVTDIVFQNPSGDQGVIQVLGDEVLLEVGLANFRDLDYHFVAPIRFNPGQVLRVAVSCANTGPPRNCTSSAYFGCVVADPAAVA